MGDLSRGLDNLERILDGSKSPSKIKLSVLHHITENFSHDRKIGQGGCAIVYKGILPKSGRTIAVKRLLNHNALDDRMFMQEVTTMMKVKHPNIVRFLGYCSHIEQQTMQITRKHILADEQERMLCFEYMSRGSLEDLVTDELRGLEWQTRFQIIKEICEGLHHLHKEINIIHMDLKPSNILLNEDLVPKISDFGISRPGNATKTMSKDLVYSLQYCAPEYKFKGEMSDKSDIYSLGVIIKEMVTGSREERHVDMVHRRWRHRWKNVKHSTAAYHQQVNKCLELAERCNYENPMERPDISDIIRELDEIDCTCVDISRGNIPNNEQQKSSFLENMLGIEPLELHLSAKVNKQISHPIKLTNDTDDYVAFRMSTKERDMAFFVSATRRIPLYMDPSVDVIPPRSSCIVTITLEALKKLLPEYYVAKLYMQIKSVRVDQGLTTKDISSVMFEEEADKVVDVVDLMVTLCAQKQLLLVEPQELRYSPVVPNKPLPCSLQLTNRTDDYIGYMFTMPQGKVLCYPRMTTGIVPPYSTLRVLMDMVVEEEALVETQCKNTCLMQSLVVDKVSWVGNVMESINEQTGVHEMELDIVFPEQPSPVHHRPMLYGEQDSEEDEPDIMGDDVAALISPLTMETGLLHIYPSELRFASEEAFEYVSLINKTDAEVICATDQINGVVLPQSTLPIHVSYSQFIYQFGVTMISGSRRYRTTDDLECLRHDDYYDHRSLSFGRTSKDVRKDVMNQVRAEGGKAQQALLPFVRRHSWLENKWHETLWMNAKGLGDILCMDVHPKEPWIVTSHDHRESHGTVCIWMVDPKGYQKDLYWTTSRTTMSISISTASLVLCVKFIARMEWDVVACGHEDGNITVHTYADNTLTEIKKFKAESNFTGVRALGVHPTLPYLLSASFSDLIHLWDWDKGWTCTKKFQRRPLYYRVTCGMCEIAFNPKDANTFASNDELGEIWSTDSEEPLTTISRRASVSDTVTSSIAYCKAGLARSSQSKGIEILDLWSNAGEHVHSLQADGLLQKKSIIAAHPTRPLLAATRFHLVYLWNYITYGLKEVNARDYDDGEDASMAMVIKFIDVNACFQRLVIASKHKIKIVDIDH